MSRCLFTTAWIRVLHQHIASKGRAHLRLLLCGASSNFDATCRTGAETMWLQKDATLSAYHHEFTNAGNLYSSWFICALHATSCILLWVALDQLAVALLKSMWTVPQTSLGVFRVPMLFQIFGMTTIKNHMLVFAWCGFLYLLSCMYVAFGDSNVFSANSQWPK